MNKPIPTKMLEATRLTQAGRLGEATALLQRALRGEAMPADRAGDTRIVDIAPDSMRDPATAPAAPDSAAPAGILGRLISGLKRTGIGRALRGREAPQAPPVAPADRGRFVTASFTNAAGRRDYKLYVPAGYRGEAVPLVVMLHGCTQSPDDFAAGTRMNLLADVHGCLVAYPAQIIAANASGCWNWFDPGHQRRGSGEPSIIAGITGAIMREFSVDPQRVYVAGLSAGGAKAAIMAAAYPDLYAAVGVHSGLACGAARDLASAFAAMRQGGQPASGPSGRERVVPTIVFHGSRDTTVHPRNGMQVIAQMAADATGLISRVELGRQPEGHAWRRTSHMDAGGQVVLEHWEVDGGGHAWFGGSPAGSHTDPRGPDASGEMLRFFLSHRRTRAEG
jgi:poly(hydroxyalkanoate) depolymerase family esterase